MNSAQRDKAIRNALNEVGLHATVASAQPLSGGCIHEVLRLTLSDTTRIVAKINTASQSGLLQEEAKGLEALARTNTVLVPSPIGVSVSDSVAVFLMESIEQTSATEKTWSRFGEELAALHNADAGRRYGFEIDNHLGTTPQPNTWCDDWVEFNRQHRLGHQVRLARNNGLLRSNEINAIERVMSRLDQFIPRHPKPALLHGDLWSGNALPASDRDGIPRIAVIDPAPSIGDGWADIAMMQLFGSFPSVCHESYAANVPRRDNLQSHLTAYQLYHVLNHVNLFGRGYAGQAMGLVRALE